MNPELEARLLKLLDEKSPDELSFEEIQDLLQALKQSEALQKALADEIRFEQVLTAVTLSNEAMGDAVLSRIQNESSGSSKLLWLFLILLTLGVGGGFYYVWTHHFSQVSVTQDNNQEPKEQEAEEDIAQREPLPVQVSKTSESSNQKESVADPIQEPKQEADETISTVSTEDENQTTEPELVEVTKPTEETLPLESSIILEAEKFASANASVSHGNESGGKVGVIHNSGKQPNWSNYNFVSPNSGNYLIKLRYTSKLSRPIKISVNGKLVSDDAGKEITDSWGPDGQRWFDEAICHLNKGTNTFRLEAHGMFPHIDKIAFEPHFESNAESSFEFDPTLVEAGRIVPFSEAAFMRPSPEQLFLDSKKVIKWFKSVPGQSFKLHDQRSGSQLLVNYSGLARLRSPWLENSVLQLSLFEIRTRLQLLFWNGDRGVSLNYTPTNKTWAAYKVSRSTRAPRPQRFALVSTDNKRHYQLAQGAFEIRVQNGELVMSRSEIPLLRAPFLGLPQEVCLDGRFRIKSIRHFLSEPIPIPSKGANKKILTSEFKELDLKANEWQSSSDEVSTPIQMNADQSVTMTSGDENKSELVQLVLPQSQLQEGILELDSFPVGSGIFFTDLLGNRFCLVAAQADRTQHADSILHVTRGTRQARQESSSLANAVVPWAEEKVFLRWILGPNILKLYLGVDGKNWAPLSKGIRNVHGLIPIKSLGFEVPPKKQIKVQSIKIRKIDFLDKLLDPQSRQLSTAFKLDEDFSTKEWQNRVNSTKPEGLSFDRWKLACTVRTIQEGGPINLVNSLLVEVLKRAEKLELAKDSYPEFLAELALISDVSSASYAHKYLLALVDSIEQRLLYEALIHDRYIFDELADSLLLAPLESDKSIRYFFNSWMTHDLLKGIYSGDLDSLHRITKKLNYYISPSSSRSHETHRGLNRSLALLFWSSMICEIPSPAGILDLDEFPDLLWHHPFSHDFNKSAYNTYVELVEALKGEAWADAARILTEPRTEQLSGLLPSVNDPNLLLSFESTVQVLLNAYPEFLNTIQTEFNPIGELRLNRAIRMGQAGTVKQIISQFPYTKTQLQGLEWLGNRALASGDFADAKEYFSKLQQQSSSHQRAAASYKVCLVHALLGEDLKYEDSGSVQLGGEDYSPEKFNDLLDELRLKAKEASTIVQVDEVEAETGSPNLSKKELPSEFLYKGLFEYERITQRKLSQLGRDLKDWERSLYSLNAHGDHLYIRDRTSVVAYNLKAKKNDWSFKYGRESGEWPLEPMGALVLTNGTLICRFPLEGDVRIFAIDVKNGTRSWAADLRGKAVSDAFVLGGKLSVLELEDGDALFRSLYLTQLGSKGEIIKRNFLFNLNLNEEQIARFQVASDADGAVASGSYSSFSLNHSGQLSWLYRHQGVPSGIHSGFQSQLWEPPVLTKDTAFVCQPHVCSVSSFDRKTGQRNWVKSFFNLRRIVGVEQDQLVIELYDAIVNLDRRDGKMNWRMASGAEGFMGAAIVPNPSRVIAWYVQPQPEKRNARAFEISWMDLKTGRELDSRLVDVGDRNKRRKVEFAEDVSMGPWIFHRGEFYAVHAIFERLQNGKKRGVLTLDPQN